MVDKLDPTEQRIVGVLIEKELTVPDSYPLTESALLAGCNQKSNRDPEMSLESFQLNGALLALRDRGWVARVDCGGRRTKYRHTVEEKLNVTDREKPILSELLCRGPQAPGALKPRIARMGLMATPDEVADILDSLRSHVAGPLVAQLPKAPRERDQRWRHCFDASEPSTIEPSTVEVVATLEPTARLDPMPALTGACEAAPADGTPDLVSRVARLEREVAELRELIERSRTDA